MQSVGYGDLAQSYQIGRRNGVLRRDATQLLNELTTGRTADPSAKLNGDFSALAGIERALSRHATYALVGVEAAGFAAAQQLSLGRAEAMLSGLGVSLLDAASVAGSSTEAAVLADAQHDFESYVSTLNTRYGGRSLFAGAAADGPATRPADELLADLRTAVAGATDAATAWTAIETWAMDAAGGFATTGYLGSDTPLEPIAIADDQKARLDTSAADPEMRRALAVFGATALVAEGLLAGAATERAGLLDTIGHAALSAEEGIIAKQADVGSVEAKIEQVRARRGAEETSLHLSREALIGVDPYETASKLEEVQSQLEILYTVTGRMAKLNLSSFI